MKIWSDFSVEPCARADEAEPLRRTAGTPLMIVQLAPGSASLSRLSLASESLPALISPLIAARNSAYSSLSIPNCFASDFKVTG